MLRSGDNASSLVVTSREAAAMSHLPTISAPNPYEVPLNSVSKATEGCSFLNSAINRGFNSSPIVFEPRMTTRFAVPVFPPEQPEMSALAKTIQLEARNAFSPSHLPQKYFFM